MSLSFIDPELDRKLNDIDEFIMEQGGNDVAVEYNNTKRILTAQIREASLGRSTALFLLATEKISLWTISKLAPPAGLVSPYITILKTEGNLFGLRTM